MVDCEISDLLIINPDWPETKDCGRCSSPWRIRPGSLQTGIDPYYSWDKLIVKTVLHLDLGRWWASTSTAELVIHTGKGSSHYDAIRPFFRYTIFRFQRLLYFQRFFKFFLFNHLRHRSFIDLLIFSQNQGEIIQHLWVRGFVISSFIGVLEVQGS